MLIFLCYGNTMTERRLPYLMGSIFYTDGATNASLPGEYRSFKMFYWKLVFVLLIHITYMCTCIIHYTVVKIYWSQENRITRNWMY